MKNKISHLLNPIVWALSVSAFALVPAPGQVSAGEPYNPDNAVMLPYKPVGDKSLIPPPRVPAADGDYLRPPQPNLSRPLDSVMDIVDCCLRGCTFGHFKIPAKSDAKACAKIIQQIIPPARLPGKLDAYFEWIMSVGHMDASTTGQYADDIIDALKPGSNIPGVGGAPAPNPGGGGGAPGGKPTTGGGAVAEAPVGGGGGGGAPGGKPPTGGGGGAVTTGGATAGGGGGSNLLNQLGKLTRVCVRVAGAVGAAATVYDFANGTLDLTAQHLEWKERQIICESKRPFWTDFAGEFDYNQTPSREACLKYQAFKESCGSTGSGLDPGASEGGGSGNYGGVTYPFRVQKLDSMCSPLPPAIMAQDCAE